MALYEDKNFKIIKDRRSYVLIRKGDYPYSYHTHFRNMRGAKILIGLFARKLVPHQSYFKTSMKRICTPEEYDSFGKGKKKDNYRNDNGR